MIKKVLVVLLLLVNCGAMAQNLTLSELESILLKSNWNQVNVFLMNKGWEYYDSKISEDEDNNREKEIMWSYEKEDFDDKALSWIHVYFDENDNDKPFFLAYSIHKQSDYKKMLNNIIGKGYKYQDSEIDNEKTTETYVGSQFYIHIITHKVKNYYEAYSTAYSICLKRKGWRLDKNNGTKKEYNEDDGSIIEYTLKDGELHGKCEKYYASGQLCYSVNFVNGKLNGIVKTYTENGKPDIYANVKLGNPIGDVEFYRYYDDAVEKVVGNMSIAFLGGHIIVYGNNKGKCSFYTYNEDGEYLGKEEVTYKDYQGMQMKYDRNGCILKKNEVRFDIFRFQCDKNGVCYDLEYDSAGKLSLEFKYEAKNDNMDGHYSVINYKDGTPISKSEGYINKGEKDNIQKHYFYKNGKYILYAYETYKDGVASGELAVNSLEDSLIVVGTIVKEKAEGKWIAYLKNSNKKYVPLSDTISLEKYSIQNYKNGVLDGPSYHYAIRDFENVVVSEGFYKNGEKNGIWKYYYSSPIADRIPIEVLDCTNEAKEQLLEIFSNNVDSIFIPLDKTHKGELYLEENYKNGNLDGTRIQLSDMFNYIEGTYKKYYLKQTYSNGKLHGEIVYKDSNNALVYSGHYYYGKRCGEWYISNTEDIPSRRIIYNEMGLWQQYIYNENNMLITIDRDGSLDRYMQLTIQNANNKDTLCFIKWISNDIVKRAIELDTMEFPVLSLSNYGYSYASMCSAYNDNGEIVFDPLNWSKITRYYKEQNVKVSRSIAAWKEYILSMKDNMPYKGIFVYKDENRNLTYECKVKNGYKNGVVKVLNSNGKVIKKYIYKDGVKQ